MLPTLMSLDKHTYKPIDELPGNSTKTQFIAIANGLVQDCIISIANALEILQSYTKPIRDLDLDNVLTRARRCLQDIIAGLCLIMFNGDFIEPPLKSGRG